MEPRRQQQADIMQQVSCEQAYDSSFENIPHELTHGIGSEQSKPDLSSLIISSSYFYTVFQPKRLHTRFLTAFLEGNLHLAAQILTLNAATEKENIFIPQLPKSRLSLLTELLCKRSTVTDHALRTFKHVTALQLAYGAQDVEMCELLLKFFAKLPNGYQIAAMQLNEKFGELAATDYPKEFREYCYDLFCYRNRADLTWEDVIKNFHDASKRDAEKSPFHFNMRQIQILLQIYSDYFLDDNFGKVWREGVGYLQQQLPACHLASYCRGFTDSSYQQKERVFKLADGTQVFPLDSNPNERLGRDYALTPSGKKTTGGNLEDMIGERNYYDVEEYIRETETKMRQFRTKLNSLAHNTEVEMKREDVNSLR